MNRASWNPEAPHRRVAHAQAAAAGSARRGSSRTRRTADPRTRVRPEGRSPVCDVVEIGRRPRPQRVHDLDGTARHCHAGRTAPSRNPRVGALVRNAERPTSRDLVARRDHERIDRQPGTVSSTLADRALRQLERRAQHVRRIEDPRRNVEANERAPPRHAADVEERRVRHRRGTGSRARSPSGRPPGSPVSAARGSVGTPSGQRTTYRR